MPEQCPPRCLLPPVLPGISNTRTPLSSYLIQKSSRCTGRVHHPPQPSLPAEAHLPPAENPRESGFGSSRFFAKGEVTLTCTQSGMGGWGGGKHPTSPSLCWWCQATHRAHSWKREKQEPAALPARTRPAGSAHRSSRHQRMPAPANTGTERHQRGWAETPPGSRASSRWEAAAGRGSGAGQALTMRSPPSAIPGCCRRRLPLTHPPSVPGPSTGPHCPRRPFYGPPPPPRHAPAVQHGGSQRHCAPAHQPRRAPRERRG